MATWNSGLVNRFSKMSHIVSLSDKVISAETVAHYIDAVYHHHGIPKLIIPECASRFTSAFWTKLIE